MNPGLNAGSCARSRPGLLEKEMPPPSGRGQHASALLAEAVMRYAPFLAAAIATQLGAGHEKHSPALVTFRLFGTVALPEQLHDLSSPPVLVSQPGFQGALIMAAVEMPLFFQFQIIPQGR